MTRTTRKRLDGRVAVVTGGSRGIGRAIALKLGEQGAHVVVNYLRDARAAASTVLEVGDASSLVGDVGSLDEAENLFEAVHRDRGRLDIVVCNAGITRDSPIIGLTPDAWSKVLRTNLEGVRHCCQAAARRMTPSRGGVIVMIGSGSGLSPRPGQVNYSTSKSAIVGLSRTLARELADRGVRVLVVAPGFTDTEMAQAVSIEAAEHSKRMIPMGRWGLPEEIAAIVAFAASDAASYLTGQTLIADGGRVALEQEFGFAMGAPST